MKHFNVKTSKGLEDYAMESLHPGWSDLRHEGNCPACNTRKLIKFVLQQAERNLKEGAKL